MTTFVKQSRLWRATALLLLLVAVAGPWTYEGVYVSPGFSCTWPNSRPEGHLYCGLALSGLWDIFLLLPLTVAVLRGEVNLSQWTAQSALHLLLTMSLAAPVLLLAVRHNARPLLFALAWVLAALAGIALLNRGYYKPYALPCGNLLFIPVALTALLLEILRHRTAHYTTAL